MFKMKDLDCEHKKYLDVEETCAIMFGSIKKKRNKYEFI